MARRPFIMWPDARLSDVAAPVAAIDAEVLAIWDDMVDIMDAMPGYGLAAPQLGVMRRLAVVDCSEARGAAIRLANPEIVAASDATFTWDEASPNLPGYSAKIARPAKVTVSFTDHEGNHVTKDFENLWATSVQHQIDHLAGRMYFDRLSKVKRDMLLRKAQKAAR